MKLDQLSAFQAVVETGSVKDASESLGKTQPTISHALKTLEFQIGASLFDRSGYRLTLTSLGERVYAQSIRVRTEVEDLKLLINHFKDGNEEGVAIAIDAAVDITGVLGALEDVQICFPDTHIELRTEVLSGTIELVKDGLVDLAISPMLPLMLEEHGFDYIPIAHSSMLNVVSPALLKKIGTPQKLPDLRTFHQIIVRDSGRSEEMFAREFGVQKGQRRWFVSDLDMKRHFLVRGLGWGRLPSHLINKELQSGQLVKIDLLDTYLPINLDVFAFRKPQQIYGPVAMKLWENLKYANSPTQVA